MNRGRDHRPPDRRTGASGPAWSLTRRFYSSGIAGASRGVSGPNGPDPAYSQIGSLHNDAGHSGFKPATVMVRTRKAHWHRRGLGGLAQSPSLDGA